MVGRPGLQLLLLYCNIVLSVSVTEFRMSINI